MPSFRPISRRAALRLTATAAGTVATGLAFPRVLRAATAPPHPHGVVRGEPTADKIAAEVLASGGNAVDALVAAALAAAVCAPAMTGIGGYGAAIVIASADGKKVACIDANSTAPAAARADMFPLDEKGGVRGRVNDTGWLAAGVPGILAGLQLALDRHGTRSFRDSVRPAIALARDGFPLAAAVAATIRTLAPIFATHPGGKNLFLKNGATPAAGEIFRNPGLAAMLETLAQRDSVDSFYRGDIAQRIADDFAKHGGLVTARDLADYRAREVPPLRFAWNGSEVCTAPLTAGGFTMLQCLAALRELAWDRQPAGLARTHAYLEALRLAFIAKSAHRVESEDDHKRHRQHTDDRLEQHADRRKSPHDEIVVPLGDRLLFRLPPMRRRRGATPAKPMPISLSFWFNPTQGFYEARGYPRADRSHASER